MRGRGTIVTLNRFWKGIGMEKYFILLMSSWCFQKKGPLRMGQGGENGSCVHLNPHDECIVKSYYGQTLGRCPGLSCGV